MILKPRLHLYKQIVNVGYEHWLAIKPFFVFCFIVGAFWEMSETKLSESVNLRQGDQGKRIGNFRRLFSAACQNCSAGARELRFFASCVWIILFYRTELRFWFSPTGATIFPILRHFWPLFSSPSFLSSFCIKTSGLISPFFLHKLGKPNIYRWEK